ncbi:hypothetical protein, variant [Aphanomyces invadans]|uniref:GST N-terminal domain-containing protein n=1 Tax=Aphanomyces invadans TaxID=157072 RepID=A0A024T867_9STRA|nr:hypothetical protein, variant [Aphanomyces invadans]ETV90173.1 hypothetical protein, variant [Aphanomyces invadans]|eukprot:XP_008881203.1 hypothetical protein, variant [Aphanomyces invadans]
MSLELVYFDETWRAEAIRLLLAYGNKSFEDTRLSFPAYSAAKPTLGLPFGQLPVLRTNGKTYAQSIAIARYVAKEVGLYPTDNLDALEVDSVVDAIVEMTNVFVDAVHSMKGEDHLKASIVPINEKIFPRILAGLEARLVGPYFLGDKISQRGTADSAPDGLPQARPAGRHVARSSAAHRVLGGTSCQARNVACVAGLSAYCAR